MVPGAWYPDEIIKDMAKSHVLKFIPTSSGACAFRKLPSNLLLYTTGKQTPLYGQAYRVDPDNNLPEQCEAMAHSVIDNLRVQEVEPKGSPIVPTDNHVALILFMLSHYPADAHMPLHCDARQFSEGFDLHSQMEQVWESQVKQHFDIDYADERFFYNREGYPLSKNDPRYGASLLKQVEDELARREFLVDWGPGNGNVREYIYAICEYAYLLAYLFLPPSYGPTNVTEENWDALDGHGISFENLSVVALSDAIDLVARIWLRVWRRYSQWKEDRSR